MSLINVFKVFCKDLANTSFILYSTRHYMLYVIHFLTTITFLHAKCLFPIIENILNQPLQKILLSTIYHSDQPS